jgi:hypothetical protein
MTRGKTALGSIAAALAFMASACVTEGDHDQDTEVISRVELTFTPVGGGDPLTFAFSDPDGDGGMSGTAERIELAAGTQYTLELRFSNDLADPAEDITADIEAEAEDHFVFILADAGLTHAYADLESDYGSNAIGDDLPVGLVDTITTDAAGTGTLRVMLRHLPELNGQPQKTSDLPQQFLDGEDLPGSADVDVSFELTVL